MVNKAKIIDNCGDFAEVYAPESMPEVWVDTFMANDNPEESSFLLTLSPEQARAFANALIVAAELVERR